MDAQPAEGPRHEIVIEDGDDDVTIAQGKVVESEFASMAVRLDTEGNSVRLRIEDLRTGRVRHLDALELESIVWLGDGHLTQLLDPSHDRWRG
ncbi:hypothetical protein [Nocardioides sp. Root190]|jgi:hypothetical protein|uniref:hypothetical protein n=1 Tax=Nocardioides sp. Root190 TaxID=1736488 RepID=UPI000A85EC0F|nr:hypothetical protein [Nocardioides sp. Root190]